MEDAIKNVVSNHEIIKAWNAYCGEKDPEGGSSDDYRRIFSMEDLPDETAGMSTFELIDAIQEGDFNVRHEYWCFGPGGTGRGSNEQLYSFSLAYDAVYGLHSPIQGDWLAEYMNRNGGLREKEKAPRLEQKSYWAATYYNLCDHDQSIELYRSRQEAIDGVIKSLSDTSEDYTQEILDDCRSALDDYEFWDNPCTDEIIRIDTASLCG